MVRRSKSSRAALVACAVSAATLGLIWPGGAIGAEVASKPPTATAQAAPVLLRQQRNSVSTFEGLFDGLEVSAPELSDRCQIEGFSSASRVGLGRSWSALKQGRPLRLLAVGSSSTVGIGASAPDRSYPARLQARLVRLITDREITVIARGLSGEVATDMAERLKLEVANHRPHLVLWQVGTNAAIARIPPEQIKALVLSTVSWLRERRIDVVLVDPQYTVALARDSHYTAVVTAIEEAARTTDVPVVRRYAAMAALAETADINDYLARDSFHMNDLGYRCLADYAVSAIVGGLSRAQIQAQR